MGTLWNGLCDVVLMSTHNLCFEQKHEKYQIFYLKTQFLVVPVSIYSNRRVFIMIVREGVSTKYFS